MHSEAMQAMYTECSNIPLPLLYRRKAFPALSQMLQILQKMKAAHAKTAPGKK